MLIPIFPREWQCHSPHSRRRGMRGIGMGELSPMVLGRESGHDVIPSQHFCVRMCIVYLCFQYTLRRFLVQ